VSTPIDVSKQCRVSLVFLVGGEAEDTQTPFTVSVEVPTAYDWLRVTWPSEEDSNVPVETLIRDKRYIAFSRASVEQ